MGSGEVTVSGTITVTDLFLSMNFFLLLLSFWGVFWGGGWGCFFVCFFCHMALLTKLNVFASIYV